MNPRVAARLEINSIPSLLGGGWWRNYALQNNIRGYYLLQLIILAILANGLEITKLSTRITL